MSSKHTSSDEPKGTNEDVFLWLQENEEAAVGVCGCILHREFSTDTDGGDPGLVLCPMHTAAPELLAALKEMLLLYEDFMPNIGNCVLQNYQRMNEAPIAADAAIAAAEGGDHAD